MHAAQKNLSLVVTHKFARALYWCSLGLLLAGMWVLIDPFHRSTGSRSHIYITLGAFELYIWLLLILARWHEKKVWLSDTVRSGLFAAVLSGLLFLTLNELYLASAGEAWWVTMVIVVLTVVKLIVAERWLGFSVPVPLLVFCLLWIAVLAIPAPLIHYFRDNKSFQLGLAYVICWLVAFLVAGHLWLVRWQIRRTFYFDSRLLGMWYVPWLLLALLAAMALGQLYSVMWGLFVDWAQWYFSPIFLAAGFVVVALSIGTVSLRRYAWALFGLTILHALAAAHSQLPDDFPTGWFAEYFVNPYYTGGVFIILLLAGGAMLLERWWLLAPALAIPASVGTFQSVQIIWNCRHGKGLTLLLAAFILLAVGVTLQWLQEKRQFLINSTTVILELDPDTISEYEPNED